MIREKRKKQRGEREGGGGDRCQRVQSGKAYMKVNPEFPTRSDSGNRKVRLDM